MISTITDFSNVFVSFLQPRVSIIIIIIIMSASLIINPVAQSSRLHLTDTSYGKFTDVWSFSHLLVPQRSSPVSVCVRRWFCLLHSKEGADLWPFRQRPPTGELGESCFDIKHLTAALSTWSWAERISWSEAWLVVTPWASAETRRGRWRGGSDDLVVSGFPLARGLDGYWLAWFPWLTQSGGGGGEGKVTQTRPL